jgi:hypothetical protein
MEFIWTQDGPLVGRSSEWQDGRRRTWVSIMTAEGDAVVLVRTSKVWWMLILAMAGLLLFVMAAPLSAVDRSFVSAIAAALLGVSCAGATARFEGRGDTLAVVGMVRIVLLSADGIQRIDEGHGPVVVTRDGRRWDPAAFQMYAAHPWSAATTHRRATAIRRWLGNQATQSPLGAVAVQQHARWCVIRWTLWGVCFAPLMAWAVAAIR